MFRIGLTGGIGSGKSTVAALLARRGAGLVDTDAIARALTLPGGAALPGICAAFGSAVLNDEGALDREHMRAMIFRDADAKGRLERILHPLIASEAEWRAAAVVGVAVVFDVPLLAESGRWRTRVDRVLVVDCPESLQVQRVIARSGWSATTVQAVIGQQATRRARRGMADAVVYNGPSTSLVDLEGQIDSLWTHWLGGA